MPEFAEDEYPHLAEAIKANELDEEEMFIAIVRKYLYAF
jgi:TetR/AcrR family transcriptional regulator, tetracycline repressor protein